MNPSLEADRLFNPALDERTQGQAIALLQAMVRLITVNPPGSESQVTDLLATWLGRESIPVEQIPLAPRRANALARLSGSGSQPALVFSGHTDTVPTGEIAWTHEPWGGKIDGRRLYGRGACDMKSGLAAMVMALIVLKRAGVRLSGDLILAASAGEEVDCLGARAFVSSGALAKAGGIVVGEPTGNRVLLAHKGALWLRLSTRGRTAHGSMPEQGENAIWHMHEALSRIRSMALPGADHPLLGRPTLSVNTIYGGNGSNVVPDQCTADIDIRTVPGQVHGEVLSAFQRVLTGIDCTIEVLTDRVSVSTSRSDALVETALLAAERVTGRPGEPGGVAFFTDASIYQPALGVPVVIFGPGEAEVAHQPDEWVDVPAYLEAIRVYAILAYERLATSTES